MTVINVGGLLYNSSQRKKGHIANTRRPVQHTIICSQVLAMLFLSCFLVNLINLLRYP